MLGKLHPSTIANGYRIASQKASEILENLKKNIDIEDEEVLLNIAKTAMTGKSVEVNKEHLAKIAVDAVKHISEERDGKYTANIENIKIEKKAGANVDKTDLIKGIILDKERLHEVMPKEVKDAKIALINTGIEVKKTEVKASIEITSPDQLQQFIDEEESSLKKMIEKIKDTGANVVLTQKDIGDLAQHFLAKEGIFTIDSVSKKDLKKLSKATGANIVNDIKSISKEDLGDADVVHEKIISGSHMTFIEGTRESKAVSLLLRGGTEHIVDEIERAINDGLKVVSLAIEDSAILPGGGAADIEISNKLKDYASTVEGREQIAIQAFADSITIIPKTIARNAGLDAIDMLMNLNTAHEKEGLKNNGIDLETGEIKDMIELGIIEPFRVKNQAIKSAAEAANMILRIDDIVASKGFVEEMEEE